MFEGFGGLIAEQIEDVDRMLSDLRKAGDPTDTARRDYVLRLLETFDELAMAWTHLLKKPTAYRSVLSVAQSTAQRLMDKLEEGNERGLIDNSEYRVVRRSILLIEGDVDAMVAEVRGLGGHVHYR